MADLKLVGAVAIKVRPDASGFRKSTERQVKKELSGVKAEVKVEAKLDATEARADAKKLEKDLDGRTVSWNVKLDHDSVRAAQKKFDSMLEPTQEIKFKLGDEKSIKEAAAKLAAMAEKAKVKITYSEDEKGFQEVLAKIEQIRRQKLEQTIHINTDDAELDRLEKEIQRKLAKIGGDKLEIKGQSTIKFEYDENRESLEATLAEIDKELAKFKDQQVYITADKDSLLAARAAVQEAVNDLPVKFDYDNDLAGLKKAIAEIDAELEKFHPRSTIEATLDEASLLAARAKLEAEMSGLQETIQISYNANRASLEKVISEIDAALAKINEVTIEVGMNEFELAWVRADIEAALAKIPVTLRYDRNLAGLQKAIAEIDAKLAEINKAEIEVELNNASLIFARARLEAEMEDLSIKIEYDENLASLKAAKAKIQKLLHIDPLHIETKLDEASLTAALAKVNAMIETAETKAIKPEVKPKISTADYLTTMAALKTLGKNLTVGIFVKLNNASVLLAAAKLTGLRAAGRWTEELTRSLGRLDRNLPIVAAVVIALSSLTSGFLSLTASAFSLGNGLGEVARMAGLLAPAMILGLGAVMTVLTGVFKDFGAAVNGDEKAIKKLTASGKKAAAEIRVSFQAIRETVSKNFWASAGDAMLRFTNTALPAVGDGLGKLATSLGGIFSGVLDSFTTFTKQSGVKVFFGNLTRGFDIARTGMASFMSGFNTLAVVGSTVFPRIGKAFEAWATRFDAWVQRLAADGTLNQWIDKGIQGLKDLFNIGGSLVKVWGNIGQAAQASGAHTLHSFSQMMKGLEKATASDRFQRNMTNIFKGAREATKEFHKALGDLGPEMDVFSVTIKKTLAGAGAAFGAFIALVGDVMSSPRLQVGIESFLGGLKEMFEELRPAAAPVAEILQTFGEILGTVARDSGPLFRTLFHNLAGVLTTAWHALEPFLPALIQIGTTVIDILGPALETAASKIIPAFATALQKIGDGLIPVIKNLADFAAGFAGFVADLPIPVLAGLVTTVLALGAAMAFAGTVVPLAVTALQAFGIMATITAAQTALLVPVVGLALAAITGLVGGGIAALATSMHSSAPFATEYAAALREDAKAAGELGAAVGEATTKLTLMKLAESGAFQDARKLGINPKEVTDAVLKGGPHLEQLQARLKGVKDAYHEASTEAIAGAIAQGQFGGAVEEINPVLGENADTAERLNKILGITRGSHEEGTRVVEDYAEGAKHAGVETDNEAEAHKKLAVQMSASTAKRGAAAAATATLTDVLSSSTAKIDAMRTTFELLVGTNAKQKAAETLGAYVTGFNNLKETVKPLAEEMKKLGDKAYGEKGFLNVAGGNKAVLQVNQALKEQVDNVWVGAKAAYDAAIKQGDTATTAFQKAKDFIAAHKGDYDQLAKESGVSAAAVQGQWDAVFSKEWVLKVSLEGATEAAIIAEAMLTSIGAKFDGKKFQAYLDANPDAALQAVTDAEGAAKGFVDKEWKAKLDALPEPAKTALRELVDVTEADWNNGDFEAILKVANKVPGLAEAILAILNGTKGPYEAIIYAAVNGVSVAEAERQLYILARARDAVINVVVGYTEEGRPPPGVAGRGLVIPRANGGILDSFGRDVKRFANGGIENHVAQIQRAGGPVRIWAEPETHAEAYIPYAQAKRPRSLAILSQVAKDFGYSLTKATEYSNGGVSGRPTPSTHNTASVHIGQLVTADADEAVRKIRISQQDALAVAGITLNGA